MKNRGGVEGKIEQNTKSLEMVEKGEGAPVFRPQDESLTFTEAQINPIPVVPKSPDSKTVSIVRFIDLLFEVLYLLLKDFFVAEKLCHSILQFQDFLFPVEAQ